MNANMNQESSKTTSLPFWVSNINAFFHLPNPKIYQLFIISSTATFSLGIALIIEWACHGRRHPGYHWIVYYAPVMIALPITVWIVCIVSAIALSIKGRVQHLLPITDHSKSEQLQDGKVLVELGQALHDQQQAVVQVQNVHDGTCDSTNEPVDASLGSTAKTGEDKNENSTPQRSFSLPLSNPSTANSKIRRTLSF